MMKYILVTLILGVVAGYFNGDFGNPIVSGFVSGYMFDFSLILLLFIMGFTFGLDKEALTKLRKAGFKILVIPFSVASGSILGGLVGGYVLGINLFGSMAVSAGFGWYTLVGPLVGQLFGVEFGALGFTVNFLREIITIMTISVTSRIGKYVPVAFGGATTMDTTLPVIVRYCGSEGLITVFTNGFVLSLIAPFMIAAIAALQ